MKSFVTQFRNLRVRTKLSLFILIPLVTMLVLIGITIEEKYSENVAMQQVSRFSSVVFTLADLVQELQKERGLSTGFVGSSGALYGENLKLQRQQTQQLLQQLHQHLKSYDPLGNFWGLSSQFTRLLVELQRLPKIRHQIDLLDSGNHFDYYSNINDQAIEITHYLQVKSDDTKLSHLSDAYGILLALQERSGQERGTLNGVFSQRRLNSKVFQQIMVYVALQDDAIRHYFTIVGERYQNMLQQRIVHPVFAEVEQMRTAAFNKWERNELLNELHTLIGYGGLIHDFKNYVIRGNPFYINRFKTIFSKAQQVLSRLRHLSGLGEKELKQLDTIEATFKQYQSLLETVTEMRQQGAPVIEIDKVVKVFDEPALRAIVSLRRDVTNIDTKTWWDKATHRIALIKEVSDSARVDIMQSINKQHKEAVQGFFFYIALMISVLTITLLFAYLLVRRLANETAQIASAMQQMHRSSNFEQLPIAAGDDEIGEIVTAFNDLVEMRNQLEIERSKLLVQLIETHKREALLTLSGGVAHNFNNKLTAILGYSSLAMNHQELSDSPKIKGYLANISQTTREASDLIEKILTYSQSEFSSRGKTTQIDALVQQIVAQKRETLPPTIRLIDHIDQGLPTINLDPEQLKQMIDALYINAEEAIEGDGFIEIALHLTNLDGDICSSCGEHIKGSFIEFSIEDSGGGINIRNMERIFEPFFSTKEQSEGAGMGLAMVYGLIRKCGGHAIVESPPGKGAKFRILLPIPADSPISSAVSTENE